MFCYNCGNKIDNNAAYCIHCGVLVKNIANTNLNNNTAPVIVPGKKLRTASLVLGIIGLTMAFIYPYVGLICSIIGTSFNGVIIKHKQSTQINFALNILGIVFSILMIFIYKRYDEWFSSWYWG